MVQAQQNRLSLAYSLYQQLDYGSLFHVPFLSHAHDRVHDPDRVLVPSHVLVLFRLVHALSRVHELHEDLWNLG